MNRLLLLSLLPLAIACQPAPATSHVVATSATPRPDHVYRLDFVLTTTPPAGLASETAFTMNLVEHDSGEMTIDKHGSAPIGLKLRATLKRTIGDDPYLETQLEMSSLDRKVYGRGDALALDGKPSVVTTLVDDDKNHYQLTVTPTKLR